MPNKYKYAKINIYIPANNYTKPAQPVAGNYYSHRKRRFVLLYNNKQITKEKQEKLDLI